MERNDRIDSLHGLRGIAVLYVVVSHIGNVGLPLFPFPHNVIGKVGVWIFFALSAYLLTTKLRAQLEAGAGSAGIVRYALNRFFRIYPLFVLVLIGHWVIGEIDSSSVGRHLLLSEGFRELWAIPVEFQYYLAVPLLALLPRSIAVYVLSAAVAVVVALGIRSPEMVFSNGLPIFVKGAPFLLASMLAILKWHDRGASGLIGWLSAGLLVACTLVFRSANTGSPMPGIEPWLSLALGVAVCGLIYAAMQPGLMQRALSVKALVWIGEISFSVYLLHMFVLRAVMGFGLFGWIGAWLTLLLSLVVSAITYRMIEVPGITAGRKLGEVFAPRNKAVATA